MKSVERQQQFLEFFDLQRKQNKVSHAYLLVGKNDTYETSIKMAQSLFCLNDGCGTCAICQRVEKNEYGDLRILSGKDQSIKKDAILDLKGAMSQTALEQGSRKVYILEDIDQASVQAMNSLLKFLEEPTSDIVAILTTQNLNKVLETIQSRCLVVHLKPYRREALLKEILEEGFADREALYLSYLADGLNQAKEIGNTTSFNQILDVFEELIPLYEKKEVELAGIKLQVACKEQKFDLKVIDWLCTIHIAYYHEYKQGDMKFLNTAKAALSIQDRIRPGVISSMLIDQFAYALIKEGSA